MRVLLDTHVFLWAASDSRKLKPAARDALRQASEIYVSAASIWEVAIKRRLGKIAADPGELAAAIEPSGFLPLPITPRHAALVEKLPDHHRDPFDRILVAQALAEPLHLITADRALSAYGDLVTFIG
jgi:PIN domain nuclease of toxin-antitoxin system